MPLSSLKLSYAYVFFLREKMEVLNREEEGKDYLEVISGSFLEDP